MNQLPCHSKSTRRVNTMFSKNSFLILTFVINFVLFTVSAKKMDASSDILHRNKRQLLYPNSTLLQFNVGFGMPSVVKNINVNYLFQANFQLPWNRTQIPVDILHVNSGYVGMAKKKRELGGIKDDMAYQDDVSLSHFYKLVESVLDSYGYSGCSCVLQTLCQLGAEPLHSEDEEDLLHEIATFVLNPMNDASHPITEGHEIYTYMKAYRHGQDRQPCNKLYDGCSISLIDLFTRLHDISELFY